MTVARSRTSCSSGTAEDYQFDLEELFENIEVIEAYRLRDPAPTFG